MQPGSLRESQVFLSLINPWTTEVIPNSYFIWLLSHKCRSSWGEIEGEEQPWQILLRKLIIAWEAYHSVQETGIVSEADGT